MTKQLKAKRLRRGTYLIVTASTGATHYLPVRSKVRRGGRVYVRDDRAGDATSTWIFDADQVVEVLTADEQAGLGLPILTRWWQPPQA